MIQLYTRVTYGIHMPITVIIILQQLLASYVTTVLPEGRASTKEPPIGGGEAPHRKSAQCGMAPQFKHAKAFAPLASATVLRVRRSLVEFLCGCGIFEIGEPSDWFNTPCAKYANFGNPEPGRPSVMQASVRVCPGKSVPVSLLAPNHLRPQPSPC